MNSIVSRDKITAEHLNRAAIVFVRQSTPGQLIHNQESRRLQYAMADKARELGFAEVQVIDDDLGRSGSGMTARPGFDALVGAVCASEVGAILCIEDSRLARNGRQWHHLVELCAFTGTLLVDPNGVYDPRLLNDRLVLGLKGSMAEFELGLIRQRSHAAIQQKAARGELRIPLPVGLRWNEEGKVELDADQRVQSAIGGVFLKHLEHGSIHRMLQWYRRQNVMLPSYTFDRRCQTATWRLPSHQTLHGVLTNPMYAGAYAFGRRENRIRLVDGIPYKTDGHMKPRERWTVLIHDHHPGYITWEQYERHEAMIAENAHRAAAGGPKAARGGRCLLVGLLRCRRCGRMLSVIYKGMTHRVPRYVCIHGQSNDGVRKCISFGGLRPDEAVAAELLRALDVHAVRAAHVAHAELAEQDSEHRRAVELELEQARYEAQLASRRYEAVDPAKRLVAAELEARWNAALERVQHLARSLEQIRSSDARQPDVALDALVALAQDLQAVWNDPAADMRVKQRIVRTVIQEIMADIDGTTNEIVLVIHWVGGRHSELRIPKNKPGHTSRWTDPDAVKIIEAMAGAWSDRDIALTLNRLRLRTGTRQTWTRVRVCAIRNRMQLPAYDATEIERTWVSLAQAAAYLGTSTTTVRRLVAENVIAAVQVVPGAPWQLCRGDLDADRVRTAIESAPQRSARSRIANSDSATLMIPGMNDGGAQ